MAPRRVTAFRIDEDLIAGLQEVWTRDGVQPSEQVRRAIRAWLDAKDVPTGCGIVAAVGRAARERQEV
jgi:hypothetical protein